VSLRNDLLPMLSSAERCALLAREQQANIITATHAIVHPLNSSRKQPPLPTIFLLFHRTLQILRIASFKYSTKHRRESMHVAVVSIHHHPPSSFFNPSRRYRRSHHRARLIFEGYIKRFHAANKRCATRVMVREFKC